MTPEPADFAGRLLVWFDHNGRHDLPWQHPRTPYRVWLSEIMLQQTQVKTAAPYFERFVAALPSLPALAAAPLDDVLALWSGLGYYTRARNLHNAARLCMEQHDGDLPRDVDALITLPGIGRSTAAAIAAQAWDDRHAILDGNVKRVLARYHGITGWPGSPAIEKQLWTLAESHLPTSRLRDYTQAQMDLGATLCTRSNPRCVSCPLQGDCVARIEGRSSELPTRKPAKAIPQRHAHVLWLQDVDGRVLLQQRPPVGIWASLWTLPQADDEAGARDWFARHLAGDLDHDGFDQGETLPTIAHAFSHYRLALQPRRWRGVTLGGAVGDNVGLRWVAPGQLGSLGIPAPIRRLLEAD
ncbi:A/G-specific adenine glycosylase [Lysobacter sp. A286]